MTAASTRVNRKPTLAPEGISLPLSEIVGGDRRLDAEVYLSEGFLVRRDLESSSLDVRLLGDLAEVWQPSRLKGIQVAKEHGLPFLAATQVFDTWPVPRKFLAAKRVPGLKERYVDAGWILVTCSGTVGNAICSHRPQRRVVVSHDLLRVQPRDDSLNGYLYTFLRTRFGRALTRSRHYGNIIKHLEPEHLAEVPIAMIGPLVEELQEEIEHIYALRDRAYDLDKKAATILSDSVGEPDALGTDSASGFAVCSDSLFSAKRRLDGQAHNPGAHGVRSLFETTGLRTQRLRELAEPYLPGRFARVYGESGPLFFGSEDIFKINPEVTKRISPATKIEFGEYRVSRNWLMMARSGQIYGLNGSVMLATQWHEDKLISEHVMRIIPNEAVIRPGYLQAFLSHPKIGQPLILSRAFGTSIPELDPDDIGELPVVRLSSERETRIADAVEDAARFRMEADEKENGAVGRLEEELERELEKSRGKQPVRVPASPKKT